MTPEELARIQIDAHLRTCGWEIQDYKAVNLGATKGIALREVPLKFGRREYLLLVDRKQLGVVEAKKQCTMLSTVADQSAHCAENLPDFLAQLAPGLSFLHESPGVETLYLDDADPDARSSRSRIMYA
jgi:type I restriction enzyme R subunit